MPGAVVFMVLFGRGFGSGQSFAMSTDEIAGTAFEAITGAGAGSGVGATTGAGVVLGGAVDLPSSLAAQEPSTMHSAIAEN